MSEQIIRAIASDYKANHNLEQAELCHCILCAGLRAALSEPPDVVVVLRWARAEKQKHEDERQEAERKRAGILPEADELYAELAYDEETSAHIYGLVIAKLEKTARLTADGWEWVEERE